MKSKIRWVLLLLVASLAINFQFTGCKGETEDGEGNCATSARSGNASKVVSPAHNAAGHGSTSHAAGGRNPYSNCASCHGSSLQGQTNYTLSATNSSTGVSISGLNPPCCTSCHDSKW